MNTSLPPPQQGAATGAGAQQGAGAGAGSGAQQGAGAGAGAQQGAGAGAQQVGSQEPQRFRFDFSLQAKFCSIATFLAWIFANILLPPAWAGVAKLALNISANAATQLTKVRFIEFS